MDFVVYSVCFGVGLLFSFLSAIFGHMFGGGHEISHADVGAGHADVGAQDSGMPGVSPFSPPVLAIFLTAFGGFGMLFSRIEATHILWLSAPLALVGAFIIAAAVMSVLGYVFHKTQSSSEDRVGLLVGVAATVITPIPAKGVGEIAYVQNGVRYSAPARYDRGAAVGNGQMVKIVRVVGSQFFVIPV